MHRTTLFIIYLALLSVLSGYLFSKVSWAGCIGLKFFYKEYSFFKIWWQGASIVFIVLMLLYATHYLLQKIMCRRRAIACHIAGIVFSLAGLYFTYSDFRQTLSHRWLGERFHLGAYCFWLGWTSICIFFLTSRSTISNRTAAKVE